MRIFKLHARNAAKVTRVTLSSAYFMAGPHTQPQHQSSTPKCGHRVLQVISCTAPKGVVRTRKRGVVAPCPLYCFNRRRCVHGRCRLRHRRRASVRAHTAGADLKPAALALRVFFFVLPGGADRWIRCSCGADGGTGRANLATQRCSHFL
jgi:hypothetical protein